MGSMTAVALIIATLTFDGNTNAPPSAFKTLDGRDGLAAQSRKPRRTRTRKQRRPASSNNVNNNTTRPGPADSPAHMAPQLEDIPPEKPPKKTPPPADKRNP